MTKEYVDNMKAEAERDVQTAKEELIESYRNSDLPPDVVEYLVEKAKKEIEKDSYSILDFGLVLNPIIDFYEKKLGDEEKAWKEIEDLIPLIKKNQEIFKKKVADYRKAVGYADIDFGDYLDTEPIEFDGTIIITDPGYITKESHRMPDKKDFYTYEKAEDYPDYDPETKKSEKFSEDSKRYFAEWDRRREEWPDDWETCDFGSHMERLGLKTFISRRTLYGDWSCTTFNLDDKEKMFGEFCADSGQVAVFLLDEVLKYNPDFDYHTERLWTTTTIKDFKGTVQLIVTKDSFTMDEDTTYTKKGEEIINYVVNIEGHGINKVTGEPINFRTEQTGF